MAVNFSGAITYLQARQEGDWAKIDIQGTIIMVRGILDSYIGGWTTYWEVYDPQGRKLDTNTHFHTLIPLITRDQATDQGTKTVVVHPYYNIVLRAVYGNVAREIDRKRVDLGATPVSQSPTTIPEPMAPEPTPSPIPTPEPTPEPEPLPISGDWTWLVVVGLVLAVVILGGNR